MHKCGKVVLYITVLFLFETNLIKLQSDLMENPLCGWVMSQLSLLSFIQTDITYAII